MKYLLTLLLFLSLSLNAAFIPLNGTPFSGSIPLLEKGSLVTSNGDNNGEFDKCTDGEFLIWDDTEDAGMKCSGNGLKFGPDVDATYTEVLHLNKGSLSTKESGIFIYADGSSSVTSYLYQGAVGPLYLGTSGGGNIVLFAGGTAMTIDSADQSVSISETGGNGGNIPHNCVERSAASTSSTGVTIECVTDEIVTGGGCRTDGATVALDSSYKNSEKWSCLAVSSVPTFRAYAICCQY